MSLIYGIINPDNKTLHHSLSRLYGGIKELPHEKEHCIIKENVGFGHLLTYNTPESLFEQQPAYLAEQRLLFTAQGRIDNREELSRKLGLRLHGKLTDGELMQAAYLKWGRSSPGQLRGDWSFAVYDYREQELFLARDQHGYTALYYYFHKNQFVFSSSPKGIFALEGFEKKINTRHFLGGMLLWKMDDPHIQAYENLYIVPPAHTLIFKDGKISLGRYWFPENTPVRSYKNTDDYAEELREIFREAVSVRLRSYKPVASMLSGGLDSGSVSAMAAHLLKQEGKQLTTFSHVPLYKNELQQDIQSRRMLDETPNILATAAHTGNILPVLLNSSHISPTEGFIQAIDMLNSHFHAACNAFWLVDLPEQAANQGFGTLLTGEMGNATISFTGVDYLLPWNSSYFFKEPKKMVKRLLKPYYLKYFSSFRDRKSGSLLHYVKNNYIRTKILEEWGVIKDIEENRKGFSRYYPDAKNGMLHILNPGGNPRCQFGGLKSQAFGIEVRDPTGDLNVIEYCLSIPNHAFFAQNFKNKQILKNMMKGYMPQEVLHSARKGIQASDTNYRLLEEKKEVDKLLNSLKNHDTIHQMIDLEKIEEDWQILLNSDSKDMLLAQNLTKGLMFSYFLYKT